MTTYTLISSDSRIIEPADLWEQRIDRRFKDRAPRLVHEGELDQWYADGVKFGNIGTNQQAGLRFEAPEKLTAAGSMATIPRGGVDPHAHVQDMDLDSVAGGVLYPSQAEAAQLRGVSRQAISKLIRKGQLKSMVIGGHTLVSRADVLSFQSCAAGRPRSDQA
jgi:excisionase family DNA binding protein